MMLKNDYLFYFCEGISSVFDSQVIALLEALKEKNIFTKIYLFLGISNQQKVEEIGDRQILSGIELVYFKLYPNYPFFNGMIQRSLLGAIKKTAINLENVIFHTRGELMAWHLNKILDSKLTKNIIPDIRGVSVEEIKEFSELGFIRKTLKIYNYKRAFKNLDKFNQLTAVSNSLKKFLIDNYNICSNKIQITPCLSGPEFQFDPAKRSKIRKELNLRNDDLLVVFSSGGTAKWQNTDILKSLAEKKIKILNLSKRKIPFKNIINKFVNYSEVPYYLNAADVGIIWRDRSIVNKVASPVKFSEYVCCGLPVITNESVDMIYKYIKKNSSGLILDNLNNLKIDSLIQLKSKDRRVIADMGLSSFGIEKIIDKYIKIYSAVDNL